MNAALFLPFQQLGKQVTLEKVFAGTSKVPGSVSKDRVNTQRFEFGGQVIFFFFRAVKKGIDVESCEFDQSLAEHSFHAVVRNLLSRMRFLVIGVMLQLAAFTIIKLEFYVARNCCHNPTGFRALFAV